MAHVLIEHPVGDLETFKQVHLDDGERRRISGSKGGKVYRAADDPNNVIVVLGWDDTERAREWAACLELEQAMQRSTSNVATPRVTVLEHSLDTGESGPTATTASAAAAEVVAHTGFESVPPA